MSDISKIQIDEVGLVKGNQCYSILDIDNRNSMKYLKRDDDNILLVIPSEKKKKDREIFIDCFTRAGIFQLLQKEDQPPFTAKWCYSQTPEGEKVYTKYYPYKSVRGTYLFPQSELLKILRSSYRVFYITPEYIGKSKKMVVAPRPSVITTPIPKKVNCQGTTFGVYKVVACSGKKCLQKLMELPPYDLSTIEFDELTEADLDDERYTINRDEILALDRNNLEVISVYLRNLIDNQKYSQFVASVKYLAGDYSMNDNIELGSGYAQELIQPYLDYSSQTSMNIANYIMTAVSLNYNDMEKLLNFLLLMGLKVENEDIVNNQNVLTTMMVEVPDRLANMIKIFFDYNSPAFYNLIRSPVKLGRDIFLNYFDLLDHLDKREMKVILQNFVESYSIINRTVKLNMDMDMSDIEYVFQYLANSIEAKNNENNGLGYLNILTIISNYDWRKGEISKNIKETISPYLNYDQYTDLLTTLAIQDGYFDIFEVLLLFGAYPGYTNKNGWNSLATAIYYHNIYDVMKLIDTIKKIGGISNTATLIRDSINLSEDINGQRNFDDAISFANHLNKPEIVNLLNDTLNEADRIEQEEEELERLIQDEQDRFYQERLAAEVDDPNFDEYEFGRRIRDELDEVADRVRQEFRENREREEDEEQQRIDQDQMDLFEYYDEQERMGREIEEQNRRNRW